MEQTSQLVKRTRTRGWNTNRVRLLDANVYTICQSSRMVQRLPRWCWANIRSCTLSRQRQHGCPCRTRLDTRKPPKTGTFRFPFGLNVGPRFQNCEKFGVSSHKLTTSHNGQITSNRYVTHRVIAPNTCALFTIRPDRHRVA